ncbi:hypothetical protein M231_03753 [Tremella mesenterica]|uniref:Rab-GAP TBC domain-containing protein n=1 Tax=Tremella mesenterica TaxID=5217 RepID=A0A4Q1BMH3_TREME|nr:hypothetical protein M231_03753 [Tremella mesenterica]
MSDEGVEGEKRGEWMDRREEIVRLALKDGDLETLRKVSSLPGGYGSEEMRRVVWPVLLCVDKYFPENTQIDNISKERKELNGQSQNSPLAESHVSANDKSDQSKHQEKPPLQERDGTKVITQDGTGQKSLINENEKIMGGNELEEKPLNGHIEKSQEHHRDEYQVSLDTKRSFVTYPVGIPLEDKENMQEDLHDLIVGILRKYPELSYFQGFHDIMSVLYLTFISPSSRSRPKSKIEKIPRNSPVNTHSSTLNPHGNSSPPSSDLDDKVAEQDSLVKLDTPPGVGTDQTSSLDSSLFLSNMTNVKGDVVKHELEDLEDRPPPYSVGKKGRDSPEWDMLRKCAEVISVCRVRDAMGKGLEPMMGMLRILKRILYRADPRLAKFSSTISPVPTLPFFALSWILCLFSHDVDTLEPIQRMFDFVLARNPISAIYLAVAILVAKKPQLLRLVKSLGPEAQSDPSLLHPLFARLPPLYPDTPSHPTPSPTLHPLPTSSSTLMSDPDAVNPYEPIPLSELFALADKLMLQYPWDGEDIRGREIMGVGSIVSTYDSSISPQPPLLSPESQKVVNNNKSGVSRVSDIETESQKELVLITVIAQSSSLTEIARLVNSNVVNALPSEEDDEPPLPVLKKKRKPKWRIHYPRDKKGTVLAIGVMLLGIGVAFYGFKAGPSTGWGRWWRVVLRGCSLPRVVSSSTLPEL